MPDKLIIFADYGLDDAAATISIIKKHMQFDKIDIVAIGGNVPPDISLRNCVTLLGAMPDANHKITVVDTTQVEQRSEYLEDIHGKDGMGDFFKQNSDTSSLTMTNYEQWLAGLSGDEIVLSLGPVTLVKPVLARHSVKQLVLMGGCVDTPPNFGEYEFNEAMDPDAFAFCLTFPHVAITLDTCRVPKLDMRRLHIEGDDVHSAIIRKDQALSVTRGEEGCFVWDDVAACYLLHPERFKTVKKTDPHGNEINMAEYISELEYFE